MQLNTSVVLISISVQNITTDGLLVSGSNTIFSQMKGNSIVLMHCSISIVNGYQLMCDANSIPEQHRGTAALFLVYSLSSFSSFSFYMFVTLTVLFLFLGASIHCSLF